MNVGAKHLSNAYFYMPEKSKEEQIEDLLGEAEHLEEIAEDPATLVARGK